MKQMSRHVQSSSFHSQFHKLHDSHRINSTDMQWQSWMQSMHTKGKLN